MSIAIKDLIKKYEVTKEKKSEYNKTYYEKNKDRLAEKWKNDETRKKKLKEYYKNNRKRILERAKRWNTQNKEARKLIVERSKKKPYKDWQVNNK
jgi:hypothetical protein